MAKGVAATHTANLFGDVEVVYLGQTLRGNRGDQAFALIFFPGVELKANDFTLSLAIDALENVPVQQGVISVDGVTCRIGEVTKSLTTYAMTCCPYTSVRKGG